MSRGIARRVMFGDRRDCRGFLAALACGVRRGGLHVEAFSLMGTHLHMLVWTEEGTLSYELMRVLNAFARQFNRKHRRDGPVFRSRFRSKPVRSMLYWRTLIRYIDHNPVKARMCRHPFEHPFGSAILYAREAGPLWLDREKVERHVCAETGSDIYTGADYAKVFGAPLSPFEADLIERRLTAPGILEDEFDELYRSPPGRIGDWMVRKAMLADGMRPWTAVAGAGAVEPALGTVKQARGTYEVRLTRKARDAWDLLRTGVLHDVAGLRCEDMARRIGCSPSTVTRSLAAHRQLLHSDETYRAMAGEIAHRALRLTFGDLHPRES